jgi:fibronectin type 3 domain-containing protein
MKAKRTTALVGLLVMFSALICDARTKHSVTLTWEAPKLEKGVSVVGYNVYRKGRSDHIYKKIATRVPGPSYEDTHVKGGQTYVYAVAALDQFGRESRPSEVARATIPSP